jgi:chromate transporter
MIELGDHDSGVHSSALHDRTSLQELSALFLRLGVIGFGGPAAHIALMHDEVVKRRAWLTEERFLDLVGAANIIPGPSSTELAIHIGWERRRWPGLVIAGLSFIVPAMLITGALGWVYVRFGAVPATAWILYGIKPVILGVVFQAIWTLLPKAASTPRLRVIGAAAAVLCALGVNELAVLFGAGVLALGTARRDGASTGLLALLPVAQLTAAAAKPLVTQSALFWVFLKCGSVLFGSGYVLVALLQRDLVERLGWLSEAQLIDAIAIGQVTPGPVFTTATFIGYVLAGPSGALVATAGIFLPAFVFVAASGPLIPRIRRSPLAAAFLDGVNVASLALMAVATAQLARAAIIDIPTGVLAVIAATLLVRFKLSPTWLVSAGAAIGWLVHALRLTR